MDARRLRKIVARSVQHGVWNIDFVISQLSDMKHGKAARLAMQELEKYHVSSKLREVFSHALRAGVVNEELLARRVSDSSISGTSALLYRVLARMAQERNSVVYEETKNLMIKIGATIGLGTLAGKVIPSKSIEEETGRMNLPHIKTPPATVDSTAKNEDQPHDKRDEEEGLSEEVQAEESVSEAIQFRLEAVELPDDLPRQEKRKRAPKPPPSPKPIMHDVVAEMMKYESPAIIFHNNFTPKFKRVRKKKTAKNAHKDRRRRKKQRRKL